MFFIDGKDNPVADVDFKANGALLTGDFTVPVNAKAFFVKIGSGEDVDNNADKGYIFPVYKDKKPISGAYAAKANMYSMNKAYGISENAEQGIADYKKEFELYPANEKSGLGDFYVLMLKGSDEDKAFVNKKIVEFK